MMVSGVFLMLSGRSSSGINSPSMDSTTISRPRLPDTTFVPQGWQDVGQVATLRCSTKVGSSPTADARASKAFLQVS